MFNVTRRGSTRLQGPKPSSEAPSIGSPQDVKYDARPTLDALPQELLDLIIGFAGEQSGRYKDIAGVSSQWRYTARGMAYRDMDTTLRRPDAARPVLAQPLWLKLKHTMHWLRSVASTVASDKAPCAAMQTLGGPPGNPPENTFYSAALSAVQCTQIMACEQRARRLGPHGFAKALDSWVAQESMLGNAEYAQTAQQRMVEAYTQGATHLTLDSMWLHSLPQAIGQITSLICLSAQDNRLNACPGTLKCLLQLRKLNLDSNLFAAVPDVLKDMPWLENLNMGRNHIFALPDWLGTLTALRSLSLGANELTQVTPALAKLEQLHVLQLHSNALTSVPASLSALRKLHTLDLQHNPISTLPSSVIALPGLRAGRLQLHLLLWVHQERLRGNVKNAERAAVQICEVSRCATPALDLSGHALTSLPTCLGEMAHLKVLDLRNNRLVGALDGLSVMQGLQSLNLDNNELVDVPRVVAQLPHLHTLSFGYQAITAFPEWLRELPALKQIGIEKTWIAAVPRWAMARVRMSGARLTPMMTAWVDSERSLSNKPQAEIAVARIVAAHVTGADTLDISSLKLSTLPKALFELKALRHLHARNNRLEAVCASVGRMAWLETLDVSNNVLRALPTTLPSMVHLKVLDISRNKLTYLPGAAGTLTALHTLKASCNVMSSIPDSLCNLQALRYLWLNDNRLAALPDGIGQLTSLVQLWLSDNDLQRLPASLHKMPALQELRLGRNPVSQSAQVARNTFGQRLRRLTKGTTRSHSRVTKRL